MRDMGIKQNVSALFGFPALALLIARPAGADGPSQANHDNIIVLDRHFDTSANLGRPGWSIVDRHDTMPDSDQVDYPRMVEGGVDGGFFAIFTPQGPRTQAGDRIARHFAFRGDIQIREMTAKHSEAFQFVTNPAEARAAVGISGDFDGGGGGDDLDSVADFPKITATLVASGFSYEDIAKIWGGNMLRVLDQVQTISEPTEVTAK